MFGSNINLDAMLQVLGKWSLSGMAIAATAKSAPKIDFQELYFWQYSTQIREQVSIPLSISVALNPQITSPSVSRRALTL